MINLIKRVVCMILLLGLGDLSYSSTNNVEKLTDIGDLKSQAFHESAVKGKKMIKAVIFDIGNVFVKVDLDLWRDAFKKENIQLPENIWKDKKLSSLIYDYSEGKITTLDFIQKFSKTLGVSEIPSNKFITAWNSVLGNLYINTVNDLENVREQGYKIYALSDNNDLHTAYIDKLYQRYYPSHSFFNLFDKVYLSQKTGNRKTSAKAWLQIMKEQKLEPQECLFVDDMKENLERAQKIGLHVYHFTQKSKIADVLDKIYEINFH